MTDDSPRRTGRPPTGQTPVRSFRPPERLWREFVELADAEGRTYSDALIEAVHDWVRKHRPRQDVSPPA